MICSLWNVRIFTNFVVVVKMTESKSSPMTMSTTAKEESLRAKLQEIPLKASAVSRLASFIAEQAKNDKSKRPEAIFLAKRAIKMAPDKPAGYFALSMASNNHNERMEALRKTVALWNQHSSITPSAFAGALVRLLVEPREDEAKRLLESKLIGKNSSKHPSKRDLSEKELLFYKNIQHTLQRIGDGDQLYIGRIHLRLGTLFRKLQPVETNRPRCISHFQDAFRSFPSSHNLRETAQFWLATFSANETIVDRCPEDYIKSLYSTFAANFDDMLLGKLKYETPIKLRKLVDMTIKTRKTSWAERACDLGCGTGLSGMAFRDCADHLIGVDLSPEMIEKAYARECYEVLIVGDVTRVLDASDDKFDLIFACDVFCYIGDLGELFKKVKAALNESGVFAFSTEYLNADDNNHPFALRECARFAHQEGYIRQLALDNDFTVVKMQCLALRQNGGKDVMGLLTIFRHSF